MARDILLEKLRVMLKLAADDGDLCMYVPMYLEYHAFHAVVYDRSNLICSMALGERVRESWVDNSRCCDADFANRLCHVGDLVRKSKCKCMYLSQSTRVSAL